MSRKVVERHVWQEALERVDAFTKTYRGKQIYGWRKETIERSFACLLYTSLRGCNR